MDRLAKHLDRNDHAAMDEAWRRWLSGFGDAALDLQVTVAGRVDLDRWDLGRRILPDHMLHAIVGGGQEGSLDGQALRTRPGDLLWVPAGHVQVLRRSPGPGRLRMHYLRFRLGRDGGELAPPPGQPPVAHLPGIAPLLDQAVAEHQHPRPDSPLRIRALLLLIFSEWRRAACSAGMPELRRRRLLDLLTEDPGRRWSPRGIADELGVSAIHLNRQVRTAFGLPLRRLLMEWRVRAAAADLSLGGLVSEVAARHGWRDPFLFSRQFRKVLGSSPSAWRRTGGGLTLTPPSGSG
jgi:AraC-like DNA-binding protein